MTDKAKIIKVFGRVGRILLQVIFWGGIFAAYIYIEDCSEKRHKTAHSEDSEYYDYGLEQDDYDWDHGAI